MGIDETLESLANRALPRIKLESYDSGGYDSLNEIEDDMSTEWENYKQGHGLEEFGELDGIFYVNNSGGLLRSEKLTVQSADYIVKFSEYELEDGEETMFQADYFTTSHFGKRESEDVPAFFRQFLDGNFTRTQED